jgi:hypothetical protein
MSVIEIAPAAGDTATDPQPDSQEHCPACAHLRDAHDAIGTRFCAATIAGELARGCACRS